MNKQQYAKYLLSPQWQEKRKIALVRAFNHCQLCNSTNNLQVHHRTYANLGNEKPEDLTVLCGNCHRNYSFDIPLKRQSKHHPNGDAIQLIQAKLAETNRLMKDARYDRYLYLKEYRDSLRKELKRFLSQRVV
jgi:5-methylcytosine-specific restriction endonuclease McrA